MEKPAGRRFSSTSYLFKNSSLHSKVLLLFCLLISCFLGFALSSSLSTSAFLVLSTLFVLIFTNRKANRNENAERDEDIEVDKNVSEAQQPLLESTEGMQSRDSQHFSTSQICNSFAEKVDLPSEEECSIESVTSENFEFSSEHSNNVTLSLATSEGSISDEDDDDSLIEIALSSNSHSGLCEETKFKVVPIVQDFLPITDFGQEEYNEVNEEENLIEIDISMGSIKCPSLEIQA